MHGWEAGALRRGTRKQIEQITGIYENELIRISAIFIFRFWHCARRESSETGVN